VTALRAYLWIGAPAAAACACALVVLGQSHDPGGGYLHAIVLSATAQAIALVLSIAITRLYRSRP
jgi:hypothetical protein